MAEEKDKQSEKDEKPLTLEQAAGQIERLTKRLDKVTKESIQRKEQLREIEEVRAAETEQIAKARKAEKDAATQAMKEQGKYRPLYEEAQKQIADLKAELELQSTKATSYSEVLAKSVDARREQLPEEYRDMVPKMSPDEQLAWLDEWQPRLVRPEPTRKNAEPNNPKVSKGRLTDVQEMARRAAGMTEDEYLAGLEVMNTEPIA